MYVLKYLDSSISDFQLFIYLFLSIYLFLLSLFTAYHKLFSLHDHAIGDDYDDDDDDDDDDNNNNNNNNSFQDIQNNNFACCFVWM